jgi:hypothetical protein
VSKPVLTKSGNPRYSCTFDAHCTHDAPAPDRAGRGSAVQAVGLNYSRIRSYLFGVDPDGPSPPTNLTSRPGARCGKKGVREGVRIAALENRKC